MNEKKKFTWVTYIPVSPIYNEKFGTSEWSNKFKNILQFPEFPLVLDGVSDWVTTLEAKNNETHFVITSKLILNKSPHPPPPPCQYSL